MRSIAVLVDASALGGAERDTLTLLRALDRSRWSPTLVHHGAPALAPMIEEAARAGVRALEVPAMPDGLLGARRALDFARLLRRLRFDVLHVQLTWPLAGKYALAAGVIARTPAVVATVHAYPDFTMTRPTAVQQRLLGHSVGCYMAVSRDLAAKVRARLRWPAERIVVIHNATEVRDGSRAPDPGLRAELAGPHGAAVVLALARLVPDKGIDVLIDAAVRLPQARIAIAGDGPARGALAAQAAERGVSDRVTLLGWRTDTAELLAASDVYVLPSRNEALGVSVLEAMAAGRPVVAARVGGVGEAVLDGETGLLVPPGDPAALARAVAELIGDPARCTQLGAAGRARVLAHFSPQAMGSAVEEVYERVLARSGSRGAAR